MFDKQLLYKLGIQKALKNIIKAHILLNGNQNMMSWFVLQRV